MSYLYLKGNVLDDYLDMEDETELKVLTDLSCEHNLTVQENIQSTNLTVEENIQSTNLTVQENIQSKNITVEETVTCGNIECDNINAVNVTLINTLEAQSVNCAVVTAQTASITSNIETGSIFANDAQITTSVNAFDLNSTNVTTETITTATIHSEEYPDCVSEIYSVLETGKPIFFVGSVLDKLEGVMNNIFDAGFEEQSYMNTIRDTFNTEALQVQPLSTQSVYDIVRYVDDRVRQLGSEGIVQALVAAGISKLAESLNGKNAFNKMLQRVLQDDRWKDQYKNLIRNVGKVPSIEQHDDLIKKLAALTASVAATSAAGLATDAAMQAQIAALAASGSIDDLTDLLDMLNPLNPGSTLDDLFENLFGDHDDGNQRAANVNITGWNNTRSIDVTDMAVNNLTRGLLDDIPVLGDIANFFLDMFEPSRREPEYEPDYTKLIWTRPNFTSVGIACIPFVALDVHSENNKMVARFLSKQSRASIFIQAKQDIGVAGSTEPNIGLTLASDINGRAYLDSSAFVINNFDKNSTNVLINRNAPSVSYGYPIYREYTEPALDVKSADNKSISVFTGTNIGHLTGLSLVNDYNGTGLTLNPVTQQFEEKFKASIGIEMQGGDIVNKAFSSIWTSLSRGYKERKVINGVDDMVQTRQANLPCLYMDVDDKPINHMCDTKNPYDYLVTGYLDIIPVTEPTFTLQKGTIGINTHCPNRNYALDVAGKIHCHQLIANYINVPTDGIEFTYGDPKKTVGFSMEGNINLNGDIYKNRFLDIMINKNASIDLNKLKCEIIEDQDIANFITVNNTLPYTRFSVTKNMEIYLYTYNEEEYNTKGFSLAELTFDLSGQPITTNITIDIVDNYTTDDPLKITLTTGKTYVFTTTNISTTWTAEQVLPAFYMEYRELYVNSIAANLSSLNASNITSGTISLQHLPTITVAKGGTGLQSLTSGSLLVGNGTSNVLQSNNLTWNNSTNTLSATNFVGNGSGLTNISASNITGTISSSNLPSSVTSLVSSQWLNNGTTIYYNNKVGVGTSTVDANASFQTNGGAFFQKNNSWIAWSDNRNYLRNTTTMADASGNGVIIGSTGTPQSKLDVVGNVSIGSYGGVNAAPTNGLIVSGNVGIGLTNPSYRLDVTGQTRFTNISHATITRNLPSGNTGAYTDVCTITNSYVSFVEVNITYVNDAMFQAGMKKYIIPITSYSMASSTTYYRVMPLVSTPVVYGPFDCDLEVRFDGSTTYLRLVKKIFTVSDTPRSFNVTSYIKVFSINSGVAIVESTTSGTGYTLSTSIHPSTTITQANTRLGILTDNPTSTLDVVGNAAIGTYAGVTAAPTNGLIVSGNVGIGKTNPSTILDVSGTVTATNFVGNGSGLTGITSSQWTSTGNNIYFNNNVGIGLTNPSTRLEVSGGPICINRPGGIPMVQELGGSGDSLILRKGRAVGTNGLSDAGAFPYSIGTIVDDSLYYSSPKAHRFYVDGATRMFIQSDGRVGIGTETITGGTQLHLKSTNDVCNIVCQSDTFSAGLMAINNKNEFCRFSCETETGNLRLITGSSKKINLEVGAHKTMTATINSTFTTGLVGINQENPAYALDVSGSINSTTGYFYNGTRQPRLFMFTPADALQGGFTEYTHPNIVGYKVYRKDITINFSSVSGMPTTLTTSQYMVSVTFNQGIQAQFPLNSSVSKGTTSATISLFLPYAPSYASYSYFAGASIDVLFSVFA